MLYFCIILHNLLLFAGGLIPGANWMWISFLPGLFLCNWGQLKMLWLLCKYLSALCKAKFETQSFFSLCCVMLLCFQWDLEHSVFILWQEKDKLMGHYELWPSFWASYIHRKVIFTFQYFLRVKRSSWQKWTQVAALTTYNRLGSQSSMVCEMVVPPGYIQFLPPISTWNSQIPNSGWDFSGRLNVKKSLQYL